MSQQVGELPRTWLTEIVAKGRKIERFFPARERKAEIAYICGAIESAGEKAEAFTSKDDRVLAAAVDKGLDVADKVEKESSGQPGPSPESACVAAICDELNIPFESLQ